MHTPGRCANTESCWIGNSGRVVRVLLGADFVCPACNGRLHAPSAAGIAGLRRGHLAAFGLGAAIVAGAAVFSIDYVPGAPALRQIVAAASSRVKTLSDIVDGTVPAKPVPDRRTAAARPGGSRAGWHILGSLDSMLLPGAEPQAARGSGAVAPGNARAAPAQGRAWAYGERGWAADSVADPARVQADAPGQDAVSPATGTVDAERTPLVVPNELAVVAPPKPSPGGVVVGSQAAEAIQPPALFGDGGKGEDEPPMAQLADLEPATAAQVAATENKSYLPEKPAGKGHKLARRRAALRDALREALSTDTEHVSLPATAAPALPRYPALFAQEYPAGRVSAVCLVTAAGSRPDCKVLGTGSSLSMTQSVGDWPVAGQVHYRPIAANARRALAVWTPAHAHS